VLYDRELHEPLTETRWSEARVRDAVAAVVADATAAYAPDTLWPAHEWDGYRAPLPMKNLYVGAAGVVWALARLARRGFETQIDLPTAARATLGRFRAEPDYMTEELVPQQRRSGLFRAETGIAFVAWSLDRDPHLSDELLALVRENVGNDANEIMWGVPGTLLVARAMHELTDDRRWAEAVAESRSALRSARDEDGLWTQHLWGETFRSLSASHGLVSNVLALGEIGNAADVLRERATVEDGRANWISGKPRLQWCVGAPGIVIHAAHYLDEDFLLAAARLIWDAGPASAEEKGAGICHGTAGNGYALLRAFAQTRDELWLERARAFAVHALEQVERLPPRYSLFTGGLGAALFAADCLDGDPRFPLLDSLEPA
jgi:hypothetical protein